MGNPWRDPDTLRELYHGQNLTLSEVADELDTTTQTIHKWMDKHGIDRDNQGTGVADERVNDPDWLEQEYAVKGRSVSDLVEETGCSNKTILKRLKKHNIGTRPAQRIAGDSRVYDCDFLHTEYVEKEKHAGQIADEIGVGKTTVLRQMESCGIDRRSKSTASEMASEIVPWTGFYTDKNGYEYACCRSEGRPVQVGIHRIVAIADGADPYKVFDGNYHTHHKKPIPWLNTRDNVEVLTQSEHRKRHAQTNS